MENMGIFNAPQSAILAINAYTVMEQNSVCKIPLPGWLNHLKLHFETTGNTEMLFLCQFY
jgi:hypothetical protein